MLTPHQRAAHLVRSQFISAGGYPKNLTATATVENSNATLKGIIPNSSFNGRIPNWRLFKILKFSESSLLDMTSATLQLHFLSGGLLWQMALIPLGKEWIQLFSLQLWVNSMADWVLQHWWGNQSRRRKTLN